MSQRKAYISLQSPKGMGSFFGDSKFSLERLEAMVRKSDICVFLLRVSGHVGVEHLKQMCKDYGVSFVTSWSNGKSSVLRIDEEKESKT
ncbi:hypothetical protein KO561_18490 [Radiobacillus kanasensis]|uniref:hypothetical protein n=1 Tax=Radiobacillus kanasensis TaxID=2844358 RepID=UPI001E4774BA|nr:hypothetical protein [Radiobacillus kanasensis]UFT99141.1 hypothetical protein KO561_18490 [Radiobacillus kanasensis]